MGKRYFCDYCERNFIDDVESRKKHLNSNHHIRNRKLHYAKCRDLRTLVEEESGKAECKRFRSQGYCPFEESCTFTHYSRQELAAFAARVKMERKAALLEARLPSVSDWLERRGSGGGQSLRVDNEPAAGGTWGGYQQDQNKPPLASALLPPSLRPLSFLSVRGLCLQDWG